MGERLGRRLHRPFGLGQVRLGRQQHVVHGGRRVVLGEGLRQVADGRLGRRDNDSASIRLVHAGDAAEQRRLAAAVGADQPDPLALPDDEADTIKDSRRAITLTKIPYLKHNASPIPVAIGRRTDCVSELVDTALGGDGVLQGGTPRYLVLNSQLLTLNCWLIL